MTISDAFVEYMESKGVGVFGQNIYKNEAPSSNKAPDGIWWLVNNGGRPLARNLSGERVEEFSLLLYRRDRNYELVEKELFNFGELLSCESCVQLQGFKITEITVVSFPTDQDLDSEDRKVGLLQINIRTYKTCL